MKKLNRQQLKNKQKLRFQPKCLHKGRQLAYSSTGHMTPCCWTNVSWGEPFLRDMFTKEMHIDNFEKIEDILESKPWKIFFDMLKNYPNRAPLVCKRHCTTRDLDHNIEGEEEIYKNDD